MFSKRKNIIDYWPIIVLLFLVSIFFGKALFPGPNQIIYGGDLSDQFFFWKSFYRDNIKNGIIPFWNPYSFSGTPFLAHPSTAAFYPFNLIFLIFPINFAFSIYLFIHVLLAGIFMFVLTSRPGLEHGEQSDKLAGLGGGMIFALSGLMAARIYSGHVDIISTLIWTPAVFWSISNALEYKRKKYIYFSILFLTLQILAGYMAVVVFTLELIFIYELVITVLGHCEHSEVTASTGSRLMAGQSNISDRHSAGWRIAMTNGIKSFLSFAFILLMSFGLSAIQLIPTIEFVRNSIRGQGLPYELVTWGSYTKDMFFMFVRPFRYGTPFPENYTYYGPGPNFFELSYFAGIIPLVLIFGLCVYQIIKILKSGKIDKFYLGLITSLIFFLFMAMGNNAPIHKLLYNLIPVYKLFRFPSQHLIMVVFIIAYISSLAISKLKNTKLKLIIIFFIALELLSFDKKFIRLSSIPTVKFDTDLIHTIQKESGLFRILPDFSVVSQVRNSWDFESSAYYEIESTSGYNPILLKNYYNFIDLLNKNHSSSISQYNVEIPPPDPTSEYIDFLNVKYVLADKRNDTVKDKLMDKYTFIKEGDSFRLYENKDYLPRFFIRCIDKDIQKVEVLSYKLNRIELSSNSNCDGILSSSEIYYPGWKSAVDEKEVPLSINNDAFRSISLAKGFHKIEFYYQPIIYYFGGLISLGSLMLAVMILRRYH